MRRIWQPYLLLLVQPVRDRGLRGSLYMTLGLLGLALLTQLLFGLVAGNWHDGGNFAIMILAAVAMLWWGKLIHSLVRQNTPANACLVPGMRVRLMIAAASAYVVLALPLAALGAVATGHFGYTLVAILAFLPFLLLVQRHVWLAFLLSMLIFAISGVFRGAFVQAMRYIGLLDETWFTLLALSMLALAVALALAQAFPRGGDSHHAWRQRLNRGLAARKSGKAPAADAALPTAWSRLKQAGYLAALRRDIHGHGHARPGVTAPQSRMLMYALGPSAHAAGAAVACVLLMVAAWAGDALGLGEREVARLVFASPMAQLFIFLPLLQYAQNLTVTLWESRPEQALLRLAPGMPAPARLNRVLGRAVLLRYLAVWLMALACAASVGLVSTHRLHLPSYGLAAVMLLLAPAALLLRDYAAMRRAGNAALTTVWTMCAFVLAMALSTLVAVAPAFPWMAAGIVVTVLVLAALRLRWRHMMAAPPAFPAGRMAA